ncbi:MAG TPA: glycosyltransferase family 39 protein, partial [Gemmatimonadaceae bacterium]|nr:glycosyltransferase family 39 protein [Gemmatimonadaceae bacterium]
MWGIHAFGYHLTNLVFHTINAFIVWRIACALLRERSAAFAAALLFVVLPVHAESVTWISGRTDVIAATFGLSAFVAYLRYVETGKRSRFAFALASLIIGLTAKEIVIALPLVMLGHALLVAGDGKRRAVRLAAVNCAAIIPYLGVRRLAVGAWIGGYGSAAHLNHDPRFISRNVCAYLVHILGFGVSPHGSGAWPAIIRLSTLALALAFVAVLAFCLADRARHRAFPGFTLVFLAVAFFVTILPSINLAVDANGTEGERYLYLSSAWFSILVAALLRPAVARPWRIAALVALLAACATALVARNHDWRRASRLCRNVIDDLRAAPPRDALYVLDMPDDIHDAYVFRNAIWDALALLYPNTKLPPIYVV